MRAAVERRRRRIEVGTWGRADVNHVRPPFIDQATHRIKGLGLRKTGKLVGPAGQRVVHADDDARDADALQRLEVGSRHLTGADEPDANGSLGLSLLDHWIRYRRMRGPTRLVTVAGRRRHTLVMNAPEPPSAESGVTSDAIGIRYQKSGSSCAPHCRLKRYVPDCRVDRPKSKRVNPSAQAVLIVSQYRSMFGQSAKWSFEQAAQGTVSVVLECQRNQTADRRRAFLDERDPRSRTKGVEDGLEPPQVMRRGSEIAHPLDEDLVERREQRLPAELEGEARSLRLADLVPNALVEPSPQHVGLLPEAAASS